MKIDEAIEILEHAAKVPKIPKDPDLNEAQRLGSEALKAIRDYRETASHRGLIGLPGEAKK